MASPDVWLRELPYVYTDGSARACGVGDCTCLLPILKRPRGDLRTTNRQDSTDAPAMVAPSISRIEKIIFSPPRKCPIDSFGRVANGTILKRLHVDCLLVCRYARLPFSARVDLPLSNLRAAKQRALVYERDRGKRNQHGVVYGRGATETNCSVLCSPSAPHSYALTRIRLLWIRPRTWMRPQSLTPG